MQGVFDRVTNISLFKIHPYIRQFYMYPFQYTADILQRINASPGTRRTNLITKNEIYTPDDSTLQG